MVSLLCTVVRTCFFYAQKCVPHFLSDTYKKNVTLYGCIELKKIGTFCYRVALMFLVQKAVVD
jgi:hypothetical protein